METAAFSELRLGELFAAVGGPGLPGAGSVAVHDAMAELPELCGEILDRFFARDQSYRTIGEELDLPAGTIASRISRCLKKLRELLEGEGRKPSSGPSGGR